MVVKRHALLLASVMALAPMTAAHADQGPALDLECENNPICLEQALAAWASERQLAAQEVVAAPEDDALDVQTATVAVTSVQAAGVTTNLHRNTQAEPAVTSQVADTESADSVEAVEPAIIIDQSAIAERDTQMFENLTQQVIAMATDAGLANDGETTAPERRAAEAFYAANDHQPVFVTAGQLNDNGKALLNLFETADAYGLNPVDFEHSDFLRSGQLALHAVEAANADIAMTLWALRYARHAQTGRVNPSEIARDITLDRNMVDPETVMPALLAADDFSEALLSYHPQHAQFHALREELARLRNRSPEEIIQPIAEGGTLRLGDVDPRVPELRARLGVPDPVITGSIANDAVLQRVSTQAPVEEVEAEPVVIDLNAFDEDLDVAVRAFQADHNLTADGIVGPATFAALNEQAGDLTPHIVANMERWRWMPRELGRFHVLANVPEYRLWVRREGETVFTTRTVVGRERHRTAIFSDEMEYMAVNPYWNVPSSIARNEILPRLLQDPGYANRGNYEILYNGRSVDPFAVNWQAAVEQNALPRIRQRPGRGNALGEIKFMFPNQHAIYFHDTPSRSLFSRDQRAFSHGCVRVLDPWAFAQALLTNEPGWDLARARSLQGSREQNIILDNHIPVHLTYFTARVDDDGRLIMARDIYGHHARVMHALGLNVS